MQRKSSQPFSSTRRAFMGRVLQTGALALTAPAAWQASAAPAVVEGGRPLITHGVASGDVTLDSAVIWSRSNRPARMYVEWSTVESMAHSRRVVGPLALAYTDFTAKAVLTGLPAGQRIFYRVTFTTPEGVESEPVRGQFITAPADRRSVRLAWSGDTCGQGYGIDETRGGFLAYRTLLQLQPEVFIHSGDWIYADNPLEPQRKLPGGGLWRNLVAEGKEKVAETLEEFRGNYRYNLLDRHYRAFHAAVATLGQWDDHEVRNNWYPGQILADPRYTEKQVDRLFRRAQRAFWEYVPLRPDPALRIYRHIPRGPLCDVFLLDCRTYRGPNGPNRQTERSPETAFLGDTQLEWLKRALQASRATWKIIANDMPIGSLIPDTRGTFENCSNGNGPPLGRELEFADLLGFLKQQRIRNVVWLTADVHHAITHHYHPDRAVFKDFDPFWEFVSGPLHAGTYGPGQLDNTFGPQVEWNSRAPGLPEAGPFNEQQFMGTVDIEGPSGRLTVTHYNRDGQRLAQTTLEPETI